MATRHMVYLMKTTTQPGTEMTDTLSAEDRRAEELFWKKMAARKEVRRLAAL
jgi:hypothetical protein